MSAKEPTEVTEEEFQVVDQSSLPRGSVLKPCQLSIEVLTDKYRGIEMDSLIGRYHELTRELMDVQVALREMNILEGFKRMTEEQQALQLLYEPHMDKLKYYAGHNNIVAITRHADLYNEEETFGEDLDFKFKFYKTLEDALAFTDGLSMDVQEGILVSPLFLAL